MDEGAEVYSASQCTTGILLTVTSSMGKSRKLGWHGYVDSYDAIFETIKELAELKMVPPISGGKAGEINYVGY